ncbi:MAG: hypothetical protein ACTHU0_10105 [Kofleriaceae bacterium]
MGNLVAEVDAVVAGAPEGYPLRWSIAPENGLDASAKLVHVRWFTADDSPRESTLLADELWDGYEFRLVEGDPPDEDSLAALSADIHRYDLERPCMFRALER